MDDRRLSGLITKDELYEALRAGALDTVVIAITDMQGRLMGKRLTADYCLQNGLEKGTHFCNYLLGTDFEMNTPGGYELMNWDGGYGDWLAVPDWSTLRVVPWLEKTAIVFADAKDENKDSAVPIAPRNLLKRQLEKAEAQGFRLFMASELEFYLFKETYEDIHQKGYRGMQSAGHYNEDYNLLQGTRNEPIYQKVRNLMVEAGIPIESSKGEAYTGQHEINMRYAEALTSADRHMMFKHGMKEICIQNDYSVTFMAKPDHKWTGSSGHIHLSLWNAEGDRNLFYDPQGQDYHMSPLMCHFLAGVLTYTRDFSLFFAPHINSYKRFAVESWAPVNTVWSYDNRSSGYRIVGDKQGLRMETRIPGADVNPYLAYTALIAAGLHGIEQKLQLTQEYKGNAYYGQQVPRIPRSLYEAMETWNNSEVVKKLLGESVAKHYYHTANMEQQQFDAVVTEWERARYFEQG
jgi:glutamine synthetase